MPTLFFDLALGNSAHGTGSGARAAVQTSAGIDHIVVVALRDRAYGAGLRAGTTADAGITDNISHDKYTSLRMYNHSNTTFQKSNAKFCKRGESLQKINKGE